MERIPGLLHNTPSDEASVAWPRILALLLSLFHITSYQVCTAAVIASMSAPSEGPQTFVLRGLYRIYMHSISSENDFFHASTTPIHDGSTLTRHCLSRKCSLHPGISFPRCAYSPLRALSFLPRCDIWTLSRRLWEALHTYSLWAHLDNDELIARDHPAK